MKTRTEEKFYCACDSAESAHAEYGPFVTQEEAEEQARIFGWSWVVCYTHVLVYEKIVDVKTAYYEIGSATLMDTMKRPGDPRRFLLDVRQQAMQQQQRKCVQCRYGLCKEHRPDTRYVQAPFDTSPVKPLDAKERGIFAQYEEQMKEEPTK